MYNYYDEITIKIFYGKDKLNQYMSAACFERGIDCLYANNLATENTKFYIVNGKDYSLNPYIEDIQSVLKNRNIEYTILNDVPSEMRGLLFDYNWHVEGNDSETEDYLGIPKLCADYGEGFGSFELALKFGFSFDKEYFYANYSFEKPPLRIKLIPSTRQYCLINSLSVLTEYGNMNVSQHNGVLVDGMYCFNTYQSEIIFDNQKMACNFYIKANISFLRGFLEYSMIDKLQLLTNRLERSQKTINKKELLIQKLTTADEKMVASEDDLSSEVIIGYWEKYYKYSMLIRKIYPEKTVQDKCICMYMDIKYNSLLNDYKYNPQDTLVSIIMPTYNRKDVIGTAIESVLKQSYQKWELIIIDDGSFDSTYEVVGEYKDPRIIYMKNTHIKGVSGARNSGLEIAKGDIIAYLDTDNTWNKDYLLLMVNTFISNPSYNAVYCAQDIYKHDAGTEEDILQYVRFAVYNHSLLKNGNYIDLNCYMHRKSLFDERGGFSEKLNRLVDWELIYRYAEVGYPYALPCRLSNYYFDKAEVQITSKEPGAYQKCLDLFDNLVKGEPLNLMSTKYLNIDGYELYSDKLPNQYKCKNKKVSIIIPSYEALHCLVVCIEAIHKFTKNVEYEIIIVDNNSSTVVKEYLENLEKKDAHVKVIFNNHNMGFTYAVNQGIEISKEDSDIVLLNNDAIVTEGWIEELYRVKGLIPDAGLIMPRQVLLPNTKTMNLHVPQASNSRELDVTLSVAHDNVVDVDIYRKYGFVKLSFAPFFLVMITRDCFNKLGMLDEKNGRHYKSDRLYCQKAKNSNIEIIYTPYSKAYHLLQQSTLVLKANDKEMYRAIFTKNDWSDIGWDNVEKIKNTQ